LNIRDAISKVVAGQNLNQAEAKAVMYEIMTGVATSIQVASFLTALHLKGETAEEIAGMAHVMWTEALHVPFKGRAIDTCGTGGDGAQTFNISTVAALVVAGAGLTVAKHGNRSASSLCGSADVLEGLGVKIELSPEEVAHCFQEAQIGFMFAPRFHPAMRFVGPVRREIGIRTVFNLLGPLTNPASACYQLIGTPSIELAEKLAATLSWLGREHALVIHGHGGLDELSLSGINKVFEVRGHNKPVYSEFDPLDLGLQRASIESLRGGNVAENVATAQRILTGEEQGPKRDVVLLNAAACLVAGDIAPDIATGLVLARESLTKGRALDCLQRLVKVSNTKIGRIN